MYLNEMTQRRSNAGFSDENFAFLKATKFLDQLRSIMFPMKSLYDAVNYRSHVYPSFFITSVIILFIGIKTQNPVYFYPQHSLWYCSTRNNSLWYCSERNSHSSITSEYLQGGIEQIVVLL
jgi:hypothetical protein